MNYPVPVPTFNEFEAARNKITRAGQFRDLLIQQYKAGYEAMWQTPRTHGERALSMEQMQLVLNEAPTTFRDILLDSASFVAYVESAYPEAFVAEGDEEPLFPVRYTSSPYEMTIDANGITLTALKPEWKEPEDE